MINLLYHYFDESAGPFRNLSDLEAEEAERVLNEIQVQKRGFTSKRSADYLTIRRSLEEKAREIFVLKGGKPIRSYPHYMTVRECQWLLEWFENGKELCIPPGLTESGKMQVTQLRNHVSINSDDLVLVSPTKRTIETAMLLKNNFDFIITPLVGPRMFPQNPESPFLICDHIYSKANITDLYRNIKVLDFNLDCWGEGINRISRDLFEAYAKQLLDWIGDRYNKIFIISHDGTITNYRILLGENGLTRNDFLGEAGVYKINM